MTRIPPTEEIEITVAAATKEARIDFRPETRLVRAGLLYGDKVTVFSLFDDPVNKLSDIASLDEDELIEFILLDTRMQGESSKEPERKLREYQRLRRKKRRTAAELRQVQSMQSSLKRLAEQLQGNRKRLMEETGANTFYDLVETGLVTVHSIDSGTPWETNQSAIPEFLEAVTNHLASGRSYPFLNPTVTNMIAPSFAAGEIIPMRDVDTITRRAALAIDLLFRLPAIDSLSAQDILSIREELASPLIRFRAAVAQFAKEIQAAPWDPHFSREAQSLHDTKVATALLDIGEAIEVNSWLSTLLSSLTKGTAIAGSSAVGMLIAKGSVVPNILITTLATLVGGGVVANDAIRQWRSAQASIERNQLFYYWKLFQR